VSFLLHAFKPEPERTGEFSKVPMSETIICYVLLTTAKIG
jgi:hypothetical protein